MTFIPGIADHDQFDSDVAAELSRAMRYGRPLSVCLFELVGFEEITVDCRAAVLDEVSQVIQVVRASDTAYHLEGGRFALLLPETNATAAEIVAGRLAMRVATSDLDVGLRWGVAPALGPSVPALMAHAASALQAARGIPGAYA